MVKIPCIVAYIWFVKIIYLKYLILHVFSVSILVFIFIAILVGSEFMYYTDSDLKFDYEVDREFDGKLHINVDITVAMPCNCKCWQFNMSFSIMNKIHKCETVVHEYFTPVCVAIHTKLLYTHVFLIDMCNVFVST